MLFVTKSVLCYNGFHYFEDLLSVVAFCLQLWFWKSGYIPMYSWFFHRTSILLRCVSDVSLLFSNNSTDVSAQVAVVKYILINVQILIFLSTNLELTLLHFVISGSRSFWWFFHTFLPCSHGLQPILWFMKFIEVNCCNLINTRGISLVPKVLCLLQTSLSASNQSI